MTIWFRDANYDHFSFFYILVIVYYQAFKIALFNEIFVYKVQVFIKSQHYWIGHLLPVLDLTLTNSLSSKRYRCTWDLKFIEIIKGCYFRIIDI